MLEEPPIARPAVGDFNNDGSNDVIIVSANAYYAYRLSTGSTPLFLPTLLFLLLLAIAFLAIHRRQQEGKQAPNPRPKRDRRDV